MNQVSSNIPENTKIDYFQAIFACPKGCVDLIAKIVLKIFKNKIALPRGEELKTPEKISKGKRYLLHVSQLSFSSIFLEIIPAVGTLVKSINMYCNYRDLTLYNKFKDFPVELPPKDYSKLNNRVLKLLLKNIEEGSSIQEKILPFAEKLPDRQLELLLEELNPVAPILSEKLCFEETLRERAPCVEIRKKQIME